MTAVSCRGVWEMEFVIGEEFDGRTVKDLLYQRGVSRGLITRLKGMPDGITLNGEHVTVRRVLEKGDRLRIAVGDTHEEENEFLVPTEMQLFVLYEDEAVMALDKPAGMPTHPSRGHYDDTLANGLAFMFGKRGRPFVFRAVNRLDRETSGIVLVAKDRLAASEYSALMCDGRIHKSYIAILNGTPEKEGTIDAPIRRNPGSTMLRETCSADDEGAKPAVTRYRLLAVSPDRKVSMVLAEPVTGRTHQIRVHFASIGCPLVGDGLYGTAESFPTDADGMISRHALHAVRLEVCRGSSPLVIDSSLPADMARLAGAFFPDVSRVNEKI